MKNINRVFNGRKITKIFPFPNFILFSGITYRQAKDLCDVEIAEDINTKETQIRNKQIKEMCTYIDCSRSKSLELCPNECFGSNSIFY